MTPFRRITVAIAVFLTACGKGGDLPPPGLSILPNPEVKLAINTPLPGHAATFTPAVASANATPSPEPSPTPTFEPTRPPIPGGRPSNVSPPSAEVARLAASVFGASLPARITIPAIGVDTAVVPVGWHVTSGVSVWDDPGYAAGFLVSGVAPGQGGNTIFYGHNNILGSVFRDLSALKQGDEVSVTNGVAVWRYRVEQVTVFQETGISAAEQQANLNYFNATPDERVTLLSCWPVTDNTHRVVVIAKPAP